MRKTYLIAASVLVVLNCLTALMPSIEYYVQKITSSHLEIMDNYDAFMAVVNPIIAVIAAFIGLLTLMRGKSVSDD